VYNNIPQDLEVLDKLLDKEHLLLKPLYRGKYYTTIILKLKHYRSHFYCNTVHLFTRRNK
jgi:hypothetical protein